MYEVQSFPYTKERSADRFTPLARTSAGINLVLLRVGLESSRSQEIAGPADQGTLLAFAVEDLDAEFVHIAGNGATVVTEHCGE